MNTKGKKRTGILKRKPLLFLTFLFGCLVFIGGHEASVRYRQDVTCTVCHEMAEPIEKWQASGTAKNHSNCAGCHYNSGIAGWLEMNLSAARFLVGHFSRPAEEPIQPMVEPLFLDEEKEPGYWSRVPNHRCFQCHDALNHRREDQQTVHGEMVRDVLAKPCMDCHNHEMRNDQPFYEKVLVKR